MIVAINTSIQGRTRYKVKGLYRSERLKDYLAMRLSAHEAIYDASLSTLTGNALIRYNSGNTPRTIASLLESILSEYQGGRSNGGTQDADCAIKSLDLQCARETRNLPQCKATKATKRNTDEGIKSKLRRLLPLGVEQKTEPWHLMETDAVLAAFGSSCATGLSSPAASESLEAVEEPEESDHLCQNGLRCR